METHYNAVEEAQVDGAWIIDLFIEQGYWLRISWAYVVYVPDLLKELYA